MADVGGGGRRRSSVVPAAFVKAPTGTGVAEVGEKELFTKPPLFQGIGTSAAIIPLLKVM